MTDLKHAPAWHTTAAADQLAEARAEITRLTDSLRWVEHCRSQAEESVQDAKDATAAAEERTQAEADRADGLEAHLRRVLIHDYVGPAAGELEGISDKVDTDVPDGVLDDVAGDLIDDLDGGGTVDGLHEVARRRLTDWAEGQ
jgi:inactivated superfamily I helicase